MNTLFDTRETTGTATFSRCGRYRYTLSRSWDGAERPGYVNWVMLNPSRADAHDDDATIRRCIGYTRLWDYGDLVVTNLFAWRSTDRDRLRFADDPIGEGNDEHVLGNARRAALVVCAWGATGCYLGRDRAVLELLRGAGVVPHALALTGGGYPVHPLRQPYRLAPRPLEALRP